MVERDFREATDTEMLRLACAAHEHAIADDTSETVEWFHATFTMALDELLTERRFLCPRRDDDRLLRMARDVRNGGRAA